MMGLLILLQRFPQLLLHPAEHSLMMLSIMMVVLLVLMHLLGCQAKWLRLRGRSERKGQKGSEGPAEPRLAAYGDRFGSDPNVSTFCSRCFSVLCSVLCGVACCVT
jgi:hypothetical protein